MQELLNINKFDYNSPLVSVVMPVYNAEKYVSEAIESILKQTYANFELIIIDDCSQDNTNSILNIFNDERIIIVRNKRNLGIAFSTNRGIELSNGKYLALMDDDDVSLPNRLERQVAFFEENSDYDVIGGGFEEIDEFGNHIRFAKVPRSNPKYIKAWLLFDMLDFSNGSTMIRKDFLVKNDLRYRDGYLGMQDYQFFIEASKVGNISSVDDLIYKKRLHGYNESYRQLRNNSCLRKKLYSEMRKKSLEISGFLLKDDQYRVLNMILTEEDRRFLKNRDIIELLSVFRCVLDQARQMRVEYLIELEYVMKRIIANLFYQSDIFDPGIIR